MPKTVQSKPDQLDIHGRMGRMIVGLADHLQQVGRNSDAIALITLAYQNFDAAANEGTTKAIIASGHFPSSHANDNIPSRFGRKAKQARRLLNPPMGGTAASVNRSHIRVAPGGGARQVGGSVISRMSRSFRSNPAIPRSSNVGGILRQIVLRARTN
jgi:hypothetical protein